MATKTMTLEKLLRQRDQLVQMRKAARITETAALNNAQRELRIFREETERRLLQAISKAQQIDSKRVEVVRVLSEATKTIEALNLQQEQLRMEIVTLRERANRIKGQRNPFAVVVDFLSTGAATLSEICEATGLNNVAVSKFLRKLESRGQAKRLLEEGQQRGAKYVLTERAKVS